MLWHGYKGLSSPPLHFLGEGEARQKWVFSITVVASWLMCPSFFCQCLMAPSQRDTCHSHSSWLWLLQLWYLEWPSLAAASPSVRNTFVTCISLFTPANSVGMQWDAGAQRQQRLLIATTIVILIAWLLGSVAFFTTPLLPSQHLGQLPHSPHPSYTTTPAHPCYPQSGLCQTQRWPCWVKGTHLRVAFLPVLIHGAKLCCTGQG